MRTHAHKEFGDEMPHGRRMSPIQNKNYRTPGDISEESGRGPGQLGWYAFAGVFCKEQDVIDVGCGLGAGLEILSKKAISVYGIDLDGRLEKSNVFIKSISDVESRSVDTVVCIDVIEHVKEDLEFIDHLLRVARKQVIISTPNYTAGRCKWLYHIREYMPHELTAFFRGHGKIDLYKGTPDAEYVFKVRHLKLFFLFNKLRVHPLSSFFARCLNNVLPRSGRILNHLFLRVELD